MRELVGARGGGGRGCGSGRGRRREGGGGGRVGGGRGGRVEIVGKVWVIFVRFEFPQKSVCEKSTHKKLKVNTTCMYTHM